MALTDTALRALKPRDKSYTLTDGRGLCIVVLPTGGTTWRFRYRLNGKQEKLPLGRYPDLTLFAARQKRDEAAQQVATSGTPARQKQEAKRRLGVPCSVKGFGGRCFREVLAVDRMVCRKL